MKPGFFTNELLAELSPWHRLLFAGLWTLADREGRLEDRPRRIKASIFPYDDVDVDSMLNGLQEKDFVRRYTADGAAYLQVLTFTRHQRPKSDEAGSLIPAPLFDDPRGKVTVPRSYKGQGTEDRGQRTEGSGADGAPLVADGATGCEAADGAGAQRRAEDFAALWNAITHPPIARCRDLTSMRRRKIKARLTERSWEDWERVFQRIQASSFCRGGSERGWVASFDWVIGSPDVAVKVLEGKYDDRAKPERPFTATEVADAKRVRANWFGVCKHDPACKGSQACIATIIRQWRKERGEAA